jgi:hypothetical protein
MKRARLTATALVFMAINGVGLAQAQEPVTPDPAATVGEARGTIQEREQGQSASQASPKPPRTKTPEELVNEWMIESGQVGKVKEKAEKYKEAVEKDYIVPKGRTRTAYTPLDDAEIPIRCAVNYSTLIKLPGKVTEQDIAIGNKDRFNIQIYQNGRMILIQPRTAFKATNAHILCDGGEKIVHLLLEENANRGEVDYQVNIMLPPAKGPDSGKLMRWIGYTRLPEGEHELEGGMGASLALLNKSVGGGVRVIRRLEIRRPEHIVGYLLEVPYDKRDGLQGIGSSFQGTLPSGEMFVFFRGASNRISCDGGTYDLESLGGDVGSGKPDSGKRVRANRSGGQKR